MKSLLFNLVICSLLLANLATANPVTTDNLSARLVSDSSSVKPGGAFYVALVFEIRDGWHTYWRNPGDSGQATSIDWQLPRGVEASAIDWPFPERQYVGPVANYGYHGTAYHRIKIQTPEDWPVGEPISLTANAKWLVCEEECIPEQGQLVLNIATAQSSALDSTQADLFSTIDNLLPSELAISSSYQYADSGDIRFEFEPSTLLTTAKDIEYFPYDWGLVSAPAKQQLVQDPSFVSITTKKSDLSFSNKVQGLLVVHQEDNTVKAFEVESQYGVLNLASDSRIEPQTNTSNNLSVLGALLFALLGGLILNLMPCVFPVLSMKAMSLVAHNHESKPVIRKHGLMYTLGILVCFAVLGIALIAVKAAGQQIGWGFQLQSPYFVSLLIVVLFVLGLSLSGYLEVGTSLMGVGNDLAHKSGYAGSFFTGVLAVVVATPCTAPFMGPAIGFALTQSTPVTLMVLMALGLGLALPFLLLSFIPVLSNVLPKPGAWMKTFQQFLAFPMFASAAWLVWVLGQQTDMNGVFSILMVLILITFTIWLWQKTRTITMPLKALGMLACAGMLIGAGMQVHSYSSASSADINRVTASVSETAHYQTFKVGTLNSLREQGQAVFVNMTAAWCITCLANEKVALSSNELETFFSDNKITYLKGDWTNQDAEITEYLQSFGRNSVPLYVFYPAKNGNDAQTLPIVLPQILTVDTVVDSMQSAMHSTSL